MQWSSSLSSSAAARPHRSVAVAAVTDSEKEGSPGYQRTVWRPVSKGGSKADLSTCTPSSDASNLSSCFLGYSFGSVAGKVAAAGVAGAGGAGDESGEPDLTEVERESVSEAVVCRLLSDVVKATRSAAEDTEVSPFHSQCAPNILIAEYVSKRLLRQMELRTNFFVVASILIQRVLCASTRVDSGGLGPCEFNVLTAHRLAITAAAVTNKFYYDKHYALKYWARIGGLDVKELCDLERHFINKLQWRLKVSTKEYLRAVDQFRCRDVGVLMAMPSITDTPSPPICHPHHHPSSTGSSIPSLTASPTPLANQPTPLARQVGVLSIAAGAAAAAPVHRTGHYQDVICHSPPYAKNNRTTDVGATQDRLPWLSRPTLAASGVQIASSSTESSFVQAPPLRPQAAGADSLAARCKSVKEHTNTFALFRDAHRPCTPPLAPRSPPDYLTMTAPSKQDRHRPSLAPVKASTRRYANSSGSTNARAPVSSGVISYPLPRVGVIHESTTAGAFPPVVRQPQPYVRPHPPSRQQQQQQQQRQMEALPMFPDFISIQTNNEWGLDTHTRRPTASFRQASVERRVSGGRVHHGGPVVYPTHQQQQQQQGAAHRLGVADHSQSQGGLPGIQTRRGGQRGAWPRSMMY
ncbi:unnamed protein product [Vitrella brassicaformis CCMP3155]|uniref:Uncharacterized protein n=1 Tax=Vitrella brassicaformis (strain CCMP3155) TaxID=1169540 RepID=A0A0G4H6C8_VITBC|nr:unnamed protein product [Vitrella brassicaformis CCMP3155]|eukprot:CEM39387.1 unnamed protein product [Vitrella brassicaformis CCMP3155]